jgi:hypothetical protein
MLIRLRNPENRNYGENMKQRKIYMTTIIAFLMITLLSATVLVGSAALEVTVNPTSGMPDDSIEVSATDFAASTPAE